MTKRATCGTCGDIGFASVMDGEHLLCPLAHLVMQREHRCGYDIAALHRLKVQALNRAEGLDRLIQAARLESEEVPV